MIAQRLAIAAIVATWSVPTIVAAQHAKAEPTAAHATAPAKEPAKARGAEHATSPAKKEVAAEPLPQKSPAKEASKDASTGAAKPTSEHAEAKSDGKDKVTAPARSKTTPKNEMEAALKRIDEQMATMRTSPVAAQSSRPRAASEPRAERVSPAPAVARINLSWRTSLVWEPELDGGTDAAHDGPHVELVWPIERLESTPLAPTSAR